MAKPRAGEAVTVNYGWTKPNVMGSDDIWGGQLNADLDGIDSVVHGIDTRPPYVLPTASTTVLGGVKVDGSTITIAGGVITGTPSSGPPVTISATPPSSPSVGTLWWDSVGGQLYVWFADANSSQWVIAVNSAASLLPASTTVLGGVKVDGTTIKAAADGTISTVLVPMGDNRLINGDMRIDQRNGGAQVAAANGGYTLDRWKMAASVASKHTVQRVAASGIGFPNCIQMISSSAYAAAAGDFFCIAQNIEADMVSDFQWGTGNAQPVTLSFWATCNVITGTFSGSVLNDVGSRSYPFTFTIPTINVWMKFTITIPGDTGTPWVMGGNGQALAVRFDLGSGANFRAPAGAWAGGNYVGANGAVSLVGTNGAALNLTGVKLEIGSVATPFNRQSLAKSMADCQRYYSQVDVTMRAYGGAGINFGQAVTLPVTMRANPTIAFVGPNYVNASGLALGNGSVISPSIYAAATATGAAQASAGVTASAEL